MKILYITNYDSMYGANQSLFNMMKLLKNMYNVEPYLLVPGGGMISGLCEKENIECFRYDFRISYLDENTPYLEFRRFTRRVMRIVDYVKIYKQIRKSGIKFNIIHSNSSVFDIGYYLAKWLKVPHVWHIREFAHSHYGLINSLSKKIEKIEYKNSSTVIAISDAIYEYIKKENTDAKIQRVYNGVNIPEAYEKEYCKNNVINFCIIGSMTYKKNQIDVIKACDMLIKREINNFRLYLVGDFIGPQAKNIKQYLENNNALKEKVIITGFCDNINGLLKDMDVGIMASEEEAFGRVTVEYMANYMPVIGTNTGGTPEIISGVGKLYKPHDIRKLSEWMAWYIDNLEMLKLDGQACRKRSELFDAKINAKKIYEIYQEMKKSVN